MVNKFTELWLTLGMKSSFELTCTKLSLETVNHKHSFDGLPALKKALQAPGCGFYAELSSMETRKAFLQDESHRIRFVYTPKHTSWLNQIEIWFSILARKLLKRASFCSVDDLRQRTLRFIDYFNRTMAKPFKWTYTGRPLAA